MPTSKQWQNAAKWILRTEECQVCEGFGMVASTNKKFKDFQHTPLVNCGSCKGRGRVTNQPKRRKKS